jgi:hypothetical protein
MDEDVMEHLELSKRETTAGTNTGVVLECLASDNRAKKSSSGAGSNLGGFLQQSG